MSVILVGLWMIKIENVKTFKPIFYKRFVNDIYLRRRVREPDKHLKAPNDYHIKLMEELHHKYFLVAELVWIGSECTTRVYQKGNRFPTIRFRKCNDVL